MPRKKVLAIGIMSLFLLGIPVIFAVDIIPSAFALTKLSELQSKSLEGGKTDAEKSIQIQVANLTAKPGSEAVSLGPITLLEGAAGSLQQGDIYGISLLNNDKALEFLDRGQIEGSGLKANLSHQAPKNNDKKSAEDDKILYFTIEKASLEKVGSLTFQGIKVNLKDAKPGDQYNLSLVKLVEDKKDENRNLSTEVTMSNGEKRWIRPLYIMPFINIKEEGQDSKGNTSILEADAKTRDKDAPLAGESSSKAEEPLKQPLPKETQVPQEATAISKKRPLVFTIGEGSYVVAGGRRLLDAPPFIFQGRTMLPISAAAEALGIQYQWDDKEKVARFFNAEREVRIPLEFDIMTINGEGVPMVAKSQIKSGRMMVPVVSLAKAFGLTIGENLIWDPQNRTVTIK